NDLRVDGSGSVYAVDTVGRAVYVFDPSGALSSSFGAWSDEGVLFFPVSIAVNNKGDIYVLDSHRGRIEVFDRSGALEFTVSRKGVGVGEVYNPSYLFIDAAGRLYVIDGARVQVFQEGK
ncbi:MAG: 6-bladed beta-propeller, partial [Deltaproteobacteria bacterium]|nr:6-bladed beta-propeller [Deltaproteobacteria bacterium]